jgi:glyoxylase-like metal-dependent hydrolase (beta-lactamase superfamily II)
VTEPAAEQWQEVGERVFVRRWDRSFDLNVGLVLGEGACLVVDTCASEAQGRELADAVRRVTPHPWVVVDTHAHFDHSFGNVALRPASVWGHRRCAEVLAEYGEVQRAVMAAAYRKHDRLEDAEEIEATRLDGPDELVDDVATLTVGGRSVQLRHLGRGHTDNDLVVVVADAHVTFAGDLVEQGAPPSFGDAFPLEWPTTLDAMLALVDGPVVPGHGTVVDRAFVEAQRAELAGTAEIARAAYAEGRPVEATLADVPFPEPYAREALERAFRQLRGDPPYDPPAEVLRRYL